MLLDEHGSRGRRREDSGGRPRAASRCDAGDARRRTRNHAHRCISVADDREQDAGAKRGRVKHSGAPPGRHAAARFCNRSHLLPLPFPPMSQHSRGRELQAPGAGFLSSLKREPPSLVRVRYLKRRISLKRTPITPENGDPRHFSRLRQRKLSPPRRPTRIVGCVSARPRRGETVLRSQHAQGTVRGGG